VSESLQAWINQTAANPAVIACGVRDSSRAIHVKSYHQEVTEAQITQAVREIFESLHMLQQKQSSPERLRWVFEGGHICCVTGPGGALVVLVVKREAARDPEIERLLAGCPLGAAGS
jgi:hypothetical protein